MKNYVMVLGATILVGCSASVNDSTELATLQAQMRTCTAVTVDHRGYFSNMGACDISPSVLRQYCDDLSHAGSPRPLGRRRFGTQQRLAVRLIQASGIVNEFSLVGETTLVFIGSDGNQYTCKLPSDALARALLMEIDKGCSESLEQDAPKKGEAN